MKYIMTDLLEIYEIDDRSKITVMFAETVCGSKAFGLKRIIFFGYWFYFHIIQLYFSYFRYRQ